MQKVLIIGGIAAGSRCEQNTIMEPSAYTKTAGDCNMLLEHGGDNDIICNEPANWTISAAGLLVLHWLDLTRIAEKAILNLVQDGRMFISFGRGRSPLETRAKVAAYDQGRRGAPSVRYEHPRAITLPIEHISYTLRPSFQQAALKTICTL